ncbi:unnamed protein product [Ilex paraguariensis]|uniref:F-box domain-containing protein n=1 Tax=Ilex paraguariensis TaxID=185542 RepID=A0ABC8RYX2_9AQUA
MAFIGKNILTEKLVKVGADNLITAMVELRLALFQNNRGQLIKGVNDLPLWIISDILSRLPLESILTCRIVCKSWYCVTRHDCFIKLQLSRSKNRLILEPLRWGGSIFNISQLPVVDIDECITRQIPVEKVPWEDFQILSSCNGLLCIKAWNGRPDPLCIYNPITGEQMILPSGSRRLPSSYMVSLGFDSSTGKYKVVRKRGIRKGKEVSRFEIISLGESSWRELDVPMLDWQASSVVFCNGVFYCQMLNRISPNYWSIHILAIDVSDEKFQVISFPDNFSRPRPYVDMMDLEGSLTLAEHDRHLMKIWRVTGNKVGDFSLSRQQRYDTSVKWTSNLHYETIGKFNDESYLLWVTTRNHSIRDLFTHFSPEAPEGTEMYSPLNIPDLPHCFKNFWFKPSFVSPLAAALCWS